MGKKSKPFMESDLHAMGMVEVAPNVFKKPKGNFPDLITEVTASGDLLYDINPYKLIGSKYDFDPKYFIAVPPCPAPRMTRRDSFFLDPDHEDPKKRQRPCVTRYFKFKTALMTECNKLGISLTEDLNICFIVPMPSTWKQSKKDKMRYEKHQQRPDRDNYLKAYQDSFDGDDGFVWDGRTLKIWGETGGIIIF